MSYAVPCLRVVEHACLKKLRRLGENGNILVDIGETVGAEDVIARSRQTGKPVVVDIAQELQLDDTGQVARHLLKTIGQPVQTGEILAETKGRLGRGKKRCSSPIDGVLISGPTRLGEVLIEPHPREVELLALISGTVASIVPNRGVVIETAGCYVHAVAGVGADTSGPIRVLSGTPTQEIARQSIDEHCAGSLLVGGTTGVDVLRSAAMAEARGIIVGSLSGPTFEWLMATPQPLTVIITDGFGLPGMSGPLFELLRERSGRTAALFVPPRSNWRRCAAEIVVPDGMDSSESVMGEFGLGSTVRYVGGNSFGELATVSGLPVGRRLFSSGRVDEAMELLDGQGHRRIVAKANVEFVA